MTRYTLDEVAEHRRLWIDALRSGRYVQGHKVLRGLPTSVLDELEIDDFWQVPEEVRTDLTRSTYCCLGVAECLNEAKWEYDDDNDDTPYFAVTRVVAVNDDDAARFDNRTNVMLTQRTARWLGLVQPDPMVVVWSDAEQRWVAAALSVLNDDGLFEHDDPWTFAQIADAIEAQPDDWDGEDETVNERARQLNDEGVRP